MEAPEKSVAKRLMGDTEMERLREKVAELKKIIGEKDDILHRKNLMLDALGHVWCSGGCKGGVFRYDDDLTLTEQQVSMVEQNTLRLRSWFENRKCRDAREAKKKMEQCDTCTSLGTCFSTGE